jgi:hypothetical protein
MTQLRQVLDNTMKYPDTLTHTQSMIKQCMQATFIYLD